MLPNSHRKCFHLTFNLSFNHLISFLKSRIQLLPLEVPEDKTKDKEEKEPRGREASASRRDVCRLEDWWLAFKQ